MRAGQRTQHRSVGFGLWVASDDFSFDAPSTKFEGRLDLEHGRIDLARLQAKFICQFRRLQVQDDAPFGQLASRSNICEKFRRTFPQPLC